jgi:arylsulfatase A-like enzyme
MLLSLQSSAWAIPKPDIVVFLADDLGGGADFRSVYALPPAATTHIDALAAEGTSFTAAIASPVCVQTRTELMSGKWHARFGQQSNGPHPPASMQTIAELLRPEGYTSIIVGKWHLGLEDKAPAAIGGGGFDEWYGYKGATPPYTITTQKYNGKGYDIRLLWQVYGSAPVPVPVTPLLGRPTTEVLGEMAQARLGDPTRTNPLFLYVPFTAPHDPLGGKTLADRIAEMNRQIGAIRAAARPGTLFFFLGDNGRARQLPYKSGKYWIHSGGVRVPLIVAGPGIAAGHTSDTPVHVVDIPATIFHAATGRTLDTSMVDGLSLLDPILPDRAIFTDALTKYGGAGMGVVQGGWYYLEGMEGEPPKQLFRITDVGEVENLAAGYTQEVERLSALIAGYRKSVYGK